MSVNKAKIPGILPPADPNDGTIDNNTILKVSRVPSIFFYYPTLPKPNKIVFDQKFLINYYKEGKDDKKRKGDILNWSMKKK